MVKLHFLLKILRFTAAHLTKHTSECYSVINIVPCFDRAAEYVGLSDFVSIKVRVNMDGTFHNVCPQCRRLRT
jgi:hypothetical protein